MKIKKLIISEETMLWNGKDDIYRRQIDIYNIEWELLYSFDPIDKDINVEIKEIFK